MKDLLILDLNLEKYSENFINYLEQRVRGKIVYFPDYLWLYVDADVKMKFKKENVVKTIKAGKYKYAIKVVATRYKLEYSCHFIHKKSWYTLDGEKVEEYNCEERQNWSIAMLLYVRIDE